MDLFSLRCCLFFFLLRFCNCVFVRRSFIPLDQHHAYRDTEEQEAFRSVTPGHVIMASRVSPTNTHANTLVNTFTNGISEKSSPVTKDIDKDKVMNKEARDKPTSPSQRQQQQQQQQQDNRSRCVETTGDDGDSGEIFPLYNYSYMDSDGDSGGNLSADDSLARPSRRGKTSPSPHSAASASPGQPNGGHSPGPGLVSSNSSSSPVVGERKDANRSSAASVTSLSSHLQPISMRAPGPGQFRKEYSDDHPLLGGAGKYIKEKSKGYRAAGGAAGKAPVKDTERIERLTFAAQALVLDPQKTLDRLRREQNDILLRVLEQERSAEEEREAAIRQMIVDSRSAGANEENILAEKSKLELLFAEERKRASQRIIQLTKDHENKIKGAVVEMMDLGKNFIEQSHNIKNNILDLKILSY